VNDGVYNTFSGVIFDHIQYHFKAFKDGSLKESAVVGPTCDALDKISLHEQLPDLNLEDLLYSENVGAYTNASATYFNGFPPAKIIHINT
jgi:ornithine decarboxylase